MKPIIIKPTIPSNPCPNEEYVLVQPKDNAEPVKLFLHDYKKIFSVPGLYECIYIETLQSISHTFVCSQCLEALSQIHLNPAGAQIMELGAGNGVTAQVFKENGFGSIIGFDRLQEAKDAAMRDRPGIYDEYCVFDLTNPAGNQTALLNKYAFNILLVVSSIGMNHLEASSLLTAFHMIETGGIIALNIYSKLISHNPPSEFDLMLERFCSCSTLLKRAEYVHRKSITGQNLLYTLFIFQKQVNMLNA